MASGTVVRGKKKAPRSAARAVHQIASLPGAKRGALPRVRELHTQLATLVDRAPEGDEWLHEIKFDGYRMFCRVEAGNVAFISRNGQDWTARMADLAVSAASLPVTNALLDGEVVVVDEQGVSDFQLLQHALSQGDHGRLLYYVFDLLFLDGVDLRAAALEDRKKVLKRLLTTSVRSGRRLRFSDHLQGTGQAVHREACRRRLEGIVSKRRDRPYRAGRSEEWLKTKCRQQQELVIGGYTRPAGSRVGFGALLLGYYDRSKFRYAGRVGTGFDQDTLVELQVRLQTLKRAKPPFDDWPRGISIRGVTWLAPKLVAEIHFSNWTRDGLLRQAAFMGLRRDKLAREVRRETPQAPKVVQHKRHRTYSGLRRRGTRRGAR